MTGNWKESSSLVWTQKKAIHHVSQTILRPTGAYNSLLFQFINWDYLLVFLALFRFEMKTDKPIEREKSVKACDKTKRISAPLQVSLF